MTSLSRVTIQQSLRNTPVDEGTATACDRCPAVIREGQPCTAWAHRSTDSPRWSVTSVVCAGCADDELDADVDGVHQVLLEASIGVLSECARQQHRPVLARPTVVDYSDPEGVLASLCVEVRVQAND